MLNKDGLAKLNDIKLQTMVATLPVIFIYLPRGLSVLFKKEDIMGREMYINVVTKGDRASYPCPSCDHGRISFCWDRMDEKEINSSKDYRDNYCRDGGWDIYDYEGVFSAPLMCNACNETVFSSGKTFYDIYYVEAADGSPDAEHKKTFQTQFFIPPLKYIKIPLTCPNSVSECLMESFSLFPLSSASTANKIRVSIEKLLDSFQIPAEINLHQRIESIKDNPKLSHLEKAMIALKWIGNEGSHAGKTLSNENIETAFLIVEHVLSEIYEPEKSIHSIVNSVVTNKGITK